MEQRIVCAAVEINGFIVTGYRHYDQIMNAVIDKVFTEEQFNQLMRDDLVRDGFIDNRGAFLDRRTAWGIALKNKQIIRDLPSAGTLFSENLY